MVIKLDVGQRPVLVISFVAAEKSGRLTHGDPRPSCVGYLDGCVSASRIVNVHIVRPPHGLQAAGQILLFIFCQNQDRNHSGLRAAIIMERASNGKRPTGRNCCTLNPYSRKSENSVFLEKNFTCPKSRNGCQWSSNLLTSASARFFQ